MSDWRLSPNGWCRCTCCYCGLTLQLEPTAKGKVSCRFCAGLLRVQAIVGAGQGTLVQIGNGSILGRHGQSVARWFARLRSQADEANSLCGFKLHRDLVPTV